MIWPDAKEAESDGNGRDDQQNCPVHALQTSFLPFGNIFGTEHKEEEENNIHKDKQVIGGDQRIRAFSYLSDFICLLQSMICSDHPVIFVIHQNGKINNRNQQIGDHVVQYLPLRGQPFNQTEHNDEKGDFR